ncbi:MAG: hypothetical protein K0A98_15215, partial [Trueperaceae bacterium]|nr:hypothetical protein [Trueperaceae bacterium]
MSSPRRPLPWLGAALLALALVPLLSQPAAAQRLVQVADGLAQPVGIVAAGDGSGRLFVVEQRGTVVALSPDGSASRWPDPQGRVLAQG